MRKQLPAIVEIGRVRFGRYASHWGIPGAFNVRHNGVEFLMLASDGQGWEHVSVSTQDHTPSWDDMCWAKDLFWDNDECVLQFHPPRDQYVNLHPHCLHLWKPLRHVVPVPPPKLVGPMSCVAKMSSKS